ncbi:MAG TPA: ATP-binding protein, partial [Bradyrhizobium sp.]|nr:ATP-binding protein [Bradyrhizobium sp.]
QALAYAPASSSPVDRANIVAASAPLPRSARPAPVNRNSMAVNDVTTVAAKGPQGEARVVATSTRIAAAADSDVWMRVMMLAPSASTAMVTKVLGDSDVTLLRIFFAKPQTAVVMSFSDDPQTDLASDHFSGSATTRLETTSFVTRTASLH